MLPVKTTWLPWLTILFVAFALRTIYLNHAPSGITSDEFHFTTHTRALALTGTDLSGQWRPWLLEPIPNGESSEFPFILNAFWSRLTPQSLLWVKIPYALIGAFSALFLGLVTKQLTNKSIGLLTALLFAINPWHIFVSRTAFDAPVALLFWLIGIYIFLKVNSAHVIWSALFFALAFYSYIGTKILLLPILVLLTMYKFLVPIKKPILRHYLIIILLCSVMVVGYAFRIFAQDSQRSGELISLNDQRIVEQVNKSRQLTITTPSTPLIYNKATVVAHQVITKYLGSFSTEVLFTQGDDDFRVTLGNHGYLYYIDAIFILIGLIWLSHKYPKALLPMLGLIALAPLPDAIRADPQAAYAFHSVLQFPFLVVISGAGIYATNQFLRHKIKPQIVRTSGFALIYIFSLINFFVIYLHSYPVYASEATDFSLRLLAKYVQNEQSQANTIYIVHPEPPLIWRALAFYTNSLDHQTIKDFRQNYLDNNRLTFQNVIITNQLQDIPSGFVDPIIIHRTLDDLTKKNPSTLMIPQLKDAGAVFYIHNGTTCQTDSQNTYPSHLTFSDLNIERLSLLQFCQKFIIR